ncbi:MAG: PhoH family protein [Zestosphaera sp.]
MLDRVNALTPGQGRLKEALEDESYSIVGVFGPTGVGKSLFALAYGIGAVNSGKYKRLVVIRPVIDVTTGREVSMAEAGPQFMELSKQYVTDVLSGLMSWDEVKKLVDEGRLTFADSHYLRGRTFDSSVIFVDDAQSLRVESLIEAVVRVGRNSRLIVAADPIFQALRVRNQDPTSVMREILAGEARAVVVDLGVKDIVREGAKMGLRLVMEYLLRTRKLTDPELKTLETVRLKSPDSDVITVLDVVRVASGLNISFEHLPNYVVVVKKGHLGRLVGKGGERISAIEKELGVRVRGVELDVDITDLIRAVHPVSWVWKRVLDVDFKGAYVSIEIEEGVFGAFVGQKGTYVRFLDALTRELFGIGVKVIPTDAKARHRPDEKPRRKGGGGAKESRESGK